MAGTRPKNTYQTVSLVILTTKGNLGQRNQGRVGKNKTPESHIVTTTFILQYHLQHLIIGFGMSSKSSSHTTLFLPRQLSTPAVVLQAILKWQQPPKHPHLHWSIKSLSNLLCVRANWTSACPYGRNSRR